jgi:hypothetical protein
MSYGKNFMIFDACITELLTYLARCLINNFKCFINILRCKNGKCYYIAFVLCGSNLSKPNLVMCL